MKRLFAVVLALACLGTARAATVNSQDYSAVALSNAKAAGLTPIQMAAKSYSEVAALAGVTLDAKGNSPRGFVWYQIRRNVGAALADEVDQATRDLLKATILAAVAAVPALKGCTIEQDAGGQIVVKIKETVDAAK